MSRHQFWYFSAIFLLSDPTLSTAFPPTVTEAVPSLCHEHHAVTLDDHFFEALAPIELRLTDPGTLITEEETPNSQKLNVHEAGHHDMSGIYEHFDGPIDFDGVLLLRHGGHPWTLISPYQPPGPSPEQTGSTVIESRPSPLSLMLTQGRHDQPEKDVNIPGSRKRPWQDLDNQVNVHASASTEEVSTDAMTFQTAPTREITADQLDAIMKANSVHKVTGGQNGDFQIFLSELQTRVFDFLVGLRLHANSVTSKRGQEFRQRIIKHVNELLNPRLLSGCRKSDDECETPKGFPLGLKTINKLQGAANASKLWIVRIVKWTDRGKRQAVKGFILASRIAKVYEIMNFYHTIASENLSSVNREQFKSTIEHLRQWFCDIIFEGTDSSLPLLGLVRLPQKPEDPQSLFGDLQIHLAKVLMNPGDVGNAQLPRISLALFGNWYKTQSHKIDFPRLEKNEFWQWIYQAALDETAQEKHKSWSTKI